MSAPRLRRGCVVGLVLGAAVLSLGCAGIVEAILETEHMGCPEHPMKLDEIRMLSPELVITAEELRRRVSELTPHVRLDTPAGVVSPELTTWFGSSELGAVNCLRERDGGFRQVVIKPDERYVSIQAQSVASIGEGRNETVAIRTGKKLSFYDLWVERVVNFNGYDSFELYYLDGTADLEVFMPDEPSTYLYLLDEDKARWGLERSQHPPIIIVPMAAGQPDVGRVGYLVTLNPALMPGQQTYFGVRPIRISG